MYDSFREDNLTAEERDEWRHGKTPDMIQICTSTSDMVLASRMGFSLCQYGMLRRTSKQLT